jgi:hypothetical protein
MVERIYPALHATAAAEELQETRVWSREMAAYVSAMLLVTPYFKAGDTRITCICDDKYTTTLEMLNETSDLAFKKYMTRKTQGCSGASNATSLPVPLRPPPLPPAPGVPAPAPAAQAPQHRRVHRCRLCRTTRKTGRAWWGARRARTTSDWDP